MAAVALRAVRKAYGDTEVLHGMDVDIASGEFVVLVGPSGSGKTTVLRVIAGLERVDAGEVLIDGRSVNGVPAKDRDVAMVFQQYALYPHLTVRGNLGFSLRMRDAPREHIAARVAEAAALLGLQPHLDRYPAQLSGGQQQRVAIGRAIVRDARIVLYDEPLSSLDGALRVQMRTELKALHARLRATSVYVTHDQAEAMQMADRIVVLRDGRVEQSGTPMALYDRPANRFVAGFIGAPAMNFVPGALLGDPRAVIAGFRPEACALSADGGLDVRIVAVEHMGALQNVRLAGGGLELCMSTSERREWRPGESVRIRPDPARLLWFDERTGVAL